VVSFSARRDFIAYYQLPLALPPHSDPLDSEQRVPPLWGRSPHQGRYRRRTTRRNGFEREHPYPSNWHAERCCSEVVIDHINLLECGGADEPFNMQGRQ
jgi:hypothetical protein